MPAMAVLLAHAPALVLLLACASLVQLQPNVLCLPYWIVVCVLPTVVAVAGTAKRGDEPAGSMRRRLSQLLRGVRASLAAYGCLAAATQVIVGTLLATGHLPVSGAKSGAQAAAAARAVLLESLGVARTDISVVGGMARALLPHALVVGGVVSIGPLVPTRAGAEQRGGSGGACATSGSSGDGKRRAVSPSTTPSSSRCCSAAAACGAVSVWAKAPALAYALPLALVSVSQASVVAVMAMCGVFTLLWSMPLFAASSPASHARATGGESGPSGAMARIVATVLQCVLTAFAIAAYVFEWPWLRTSGGGGGGVIDGSAFVGRAAEASFAARLLGLARDGRRLAALGAVAFVSAAYPLLIVHRGAAWSGAPPASSLLPACAVGMLSSCLAFAFAYPGAFSLALVAGAWVLAFVTALRSMLPRARLPRMRRATDAALWAVSTAFSLLSFTYAVAVLVYGIVPTERGAAMVALVGLPHAHATRWPLALQLATVVSATCYARCISAGAVGGRARQRERQAPSEQEAASTTTTSSSAAAAAASSAGAGRQQAYERGASDGILDALLIALAVNAGAGHRATVLHGVLVLLLAVAATVRTVAWASQRRSRGGRMALAALWTTLALYAFAMAVVQCVVCRMPYVRCAGRDHISGAAPACRPHAAASGALVVLSVLQMARFGAWNAVHAAAFAPGRQRGQRILSSSSSPAISAWLRCAALVCAPLLAPPRSILRLVQMLALVWLADCRQPRAATATVAASTQRSLLRLPALPSAWRPWRLSAHVCGASLTRYALIAHTTMLVARYAIQLYRRGGDGGGGGGGALADALVVALLALRCAHRDDADAGSAQAMEKRADANEPGIIANYADAVVIGLTALSAVVLLGARTLFGSAYLVVLAASWLLRAMPEGSSSSDSSCSGNGGETVVTGERCDSTALARASLLMLAVQYAYWALTPATATGMGVMPRQTGVAPAWARWIGLHADMPPRAVASRHVVAHLLVLGAAALHCGVRRAARVHSQPQQQQQQQTRHDERGPVSSGGRDVVAADKLE